MMYFEINHQATNSLYLFFEKFAKGQGHYGWEAGKCEIAEKWKFAKLFFIYDELFSSCVNGKFNRF